MDAVIFWFTGQPGAGKSTLALALKEKLGQRGYPVVHLDGEEWRDALGNRDFSAEGRQKNVEQAQWFCEKLQRSGIMVIASFVSPQRHVRERLKARAPVVEIHVHTSQPRGREHLFAKSYEPPLDQAIDLDTGAHSVAECLERILTAGHLPSQRCLRQGDPGTKGEYALFIGRWQPWHQGHQWLVDQALAAGKKVLIGVREVDASEKNPQPPDEVVRVISEKLAPLVRQGRVKVMVLPDIESVNIGRQVGYSIIEHFPPENIGVISGTATRRALGTKS
jgi:adenylylsulfate kinase-like enzyme